MSSASDGSMLPIFVTAAVLVTSSVPALAAEYEPCETGGGAKLCYQVKIKKLIVTVGINIKCANEFREVKKMTVIQILLCIFHQHSLLH